MLIWPTYPNIGCDDRNQFDLILSMPGGIKKIKELINIFHNKYNINVLWPYNPWDQYTNNTNIPDQQSISIFQNITNSDGFNGDTMSYIPQNYYTYSINHFNHSIALEAGMFCFFFFFFCFFLFFCARIV